MDSDFETIRSAFQRAGIKFFTAGGLPNIIWFGGGVDLTFCFDAEGRLTELDAQCDICSERENGLP